MKIEHMLEIIQELKEKRDTCGLHHMTFVDGVPLDNKKQVEDEQQRRFFSWWDSWIKPKLEILEKELEKERGTPDFLCQAFNEGDGTYKP